MLTYHQDNFQKEVLESGKPVLIDFWTPWCKPCQRLTPVIEEIAALFHREIEVGKVNIDKEPNLAKKCGIMSVPTLCLFRNGKTVLRLVGIQPKRRIIEEIQKYIK